MSSANKQSSLLTCSQIVDICYVIQCTQATTRESESKLQHQPSQKVLQDTRFVFSSSTTFSMRLVMIVVLIGSTLKESVSLPSPISP